LVQKLSQAIQYAHEQGTLHRDLKPSNVLLDSSNEPHITDFGLAKLRHDGAELTLSGQLLGSANFLPPEQLAVRRSEITVASDVYALGAILYCVLTGRPPFVGESVESTLIQVISDEPLAPRLLNPAVPPDVETICLKCLEKDPARRYASAAELAGDLGRFLQYEPIHARPLGTPTKLWRWSRRHPHGRVPSASRYSRSSRLRWCCLMPHAGWLQRNAWFYRLLMSPTSVSLPKR